MGATAVRRQLIKKGINPVDIPLRMTMQEAVNIMFVNQVAYVDMAESLGVDRCSVLRMVARVPIYDLKNLVTTKQPPWVSTK